ncbi:MAG: 50S ribosomal protein L10 [Armatimonadetes bacterium]|nr:50S ribosomal protein L10 [Armatimonadota bacterium]
MPTAEKIKQVKNLKERFERASGVFFTEFRGLSVPQMQQLRRDLRAAGAEFSVVKNTLFKLATGDVFESFPDGMSTGPTAVAFIFDDEAAVAKALFDFAKTHKALVVKGGYVDGTAYSAEVVEQLSKLPPKDMLLSQLIGVIAAPMSNIASTIEAIYSGPIFAIAAIADKLGDGVESTSKSEPTEDGGADTSGDSTTESAEPSPEAETTASDAEPESAEPSVEAEGTASDADTESTEPSAETEATTSDAEPDTPAAAETEGQPESKTEEPSDEETQE